MSKNIIEKSKIPDFEKKPVVYKKPSEILTPKVKIIDIQDPNFKVVKLVQGRDIIFLPESTYNKSNMSIDNLEHGWQKSDLNAFIRTVFKPDPNETYQVYLLTNTGWRTGGTEKGSQLRDYVNYSNVLDSDRNFVENDNEIVYAIQIERIP